jgi:uncharacterized protein
MRWTIALFVFCLIPAKSAWCEDISLNIGSHKIRATLANTQHSRAQGLMNTTHLCDGCGMLFIFPQPGKHKFWMKDTPLSLSIAFISAEGRIVKITEMQANTLHTHSAQEDVLYALEMKAGWFSKHSVKVHDQLHGLDQALTAQ